MITSASVSARIGSADQPEALFALSLNMISSYVAATEKDAVAIAIVLKHATAVVGVVVAVTDCQATQAGSIHCTDKER